MKDNQAANNVIQFPGRGKEPAKPVTPKTENTPSKKPSSPKSKKNLGASVLAVILATLAVNHYAFKSEFSLDLASQSGSGRHIASVERVSLQRDANWEKALAERLASPRVREVASTQVGRPATMEEKLRWGTLEEKYTITFRPDIHEIDSISFQDVTSNPSYILNRGQFLREYSELFNATSAKLKSVEESKDKTIESYTLFDEQDRAKGQARFELDRHKRLLSLKVEPAQL